MFNALRDARLGKRSGDMNDLSWRTNAQMDKLAPFCPKSHGKPRVDDRRVLSGIVFIHRNGLRWSETGVVARMMVGLAADHGEEKTVMIDATDLKAHRTATNLAAKKGGVDA